MSDIRPASIVVLPPESPAPSRRGRLVGAVVGAVALVGGALFAVTSLGDDGNAPEDPVRALLEAAADGDALGMLEQLVPGERDALRGPLTDLVDQLERLGLLDDVDLGDLDAYELSFDDLSFEVDERSDDLASVRVASGTATYTFDPRDLPLGPFLRDVLGDALDEAEAVSGSDEAASDDEPFEVVTVRRGDRWYVSFGYTIAESAREDAGVDLDELVAGVAATGADDAEAAVEGLIRAAADLDLRAVLARLHPGEMEALQRYASLFLPDAEAAIDESGSAVSVTVDRLELSSDVDGDTAVVKIDLLEGSFEGEGFSMRLADGCVEFEGPGVEPQRSCGDDAAAGALGGLGAGGLGIGSAGTADVGIVAVRVDGEWYVSPVRTALDALVATLEALEPEDLEDLADAIAQLSTLGVAGFGEEGLGSGTGG